jgi:membrane associated rhomboid family serine protease
MYRTYSRATVPSVTPVVRWLLIINIGAFILQNIYRGAYLQVFGLVPSNVLGEGYVWQLVTYMFLHGNFLHILFNMLFLWMMGSELERHWGSREFLKYYLITGAGAGLINVLVQPSSGIPTIGASGAIFGLIIAFAMTFPERVLLLYFVIRIKAKYFAVLVGLLELLALFLMPGAPIARFAHLGGLVVGFVYLRRRRIFGAIFRRASGVQDRLAEAAERRAEERRMRIQEEINRILDKINNEGMHALTDRERRFLEEQSRGRK